MCGGTNCNHKNNMTSTSSNQSRSTVQCTPDSGCCVAGVKRRSRKVSFNETVQVVLIPCIQEYKDAKIFRSIWWDQNELRGFQIAMGLSFRRFMETADYGNLRQALRMFIDDELTRDEGSDVYPKRIVETFSPLEVIPSLKRIRV